MQSAARSNKLCVTSFSYSTPNRKLLPRLDIVKWIQYHKSGWSTQNSADNQGKQFVVDLSEALWYLDIHGYKKLEERSFHIPHLFHEFLNRANPESYKEARKPFDANELNLHCQAIASFATSPWMKSSNFTWLSKEFDELILVISGYVDYLQKQKIITATNHGNEVLVRDIEQATTIKVHKPNTWIDPKNKKKLL
ncbi:hypothetical protein C2G38_2192362 [Gigaspora rosea]|uniref:Uncharacterized protein n=1 Tax=Gigaspora rosea TaxID=44941 RepID=A0A397V0B9_9GLOM|nr:hypothetical protein C2G38_2192362 [Gigaspora rosea]